MNSKRFLHKWCISITGAVYLKYIHVLRKVIIGTNSGIILCNITNPTLPRDVEILLRKIIPGLFLRKVGIGTTLNVMFFFFFSYGTKS